MTISFIIQCGQYQRIDLYMVAELEKSQNIDGSDRLMIADGPHLITGNRLHKVVEELITLYDL